MALGGPSKTRSESSKSGGSLLHFMRVLKYARPYYRYLIPGTLCIVVVAVTYSVNIAALLPAFHLIAKNQGVPAWVHQSVAEKRLGLMLGFGEANQPIRVVEVKKDKYIDGRIWEQDSLNRIDGKDLTAGEMCRQIAYLPNGTSVRLGLVHLKVDPNDATARPKIEPYEVVARPKDINWSERAMRYGATWLPQGIEKGDRLMTLVYILVVIVAISIVGGICRFFGEYLIALTAARTVVALRRKMYQRVLSLPISHFASHGVGDMVSRFVQDSIDVYRGLNFIFAKSLRDPLKALFALLVALAIDWRLTVITITTAPIAAVIIRRMGKMIRKASKRLLQNYGQMVSVLEGTLIGIRVVKGYTMETYERVRLHSLDKVMLEHQLRIERIDAASSPIFETVGQIIASLAIIYFAKQMFEDRMEFSKFAALGVAMAAIFDPVRKMSSFYNRLQSANAAMDRVFEVIHLPEETTHTNGTMRSLPPFGSSIEFRNVTFKYPGSDQPALDHVNLTIRCGERVAIVGPNGSGKTTFVSLILRFFEPQDGEIVIDGRNIRDFTIGSVRRQMSLLTQDTVIFADTIANNIAYGDDKLLRKRVLQRRHPERNYHLNGQDDRITAAAKAAFADEFIREKPDGYETLVGEHGTTLSGGQKQRLSIARAILRNAPIFIFDEATSQIDSESEHKIHDAVERFLQGRTALIIAHRFSTILQADRIVVMDRGQIVDSGRHEELIARCQLYQNLYKTQIVKDS